MIQRKQTIFLLLAVVCQIVALTMPLAETVSDGFVTGTLHNLFWRDASGVSHFTAWPLCVILSLSAAIGLYTIFLYKRRPLQATMALVAIVLDLAWYVALLVVSKAISPDAAQFHPLTATALPAVAIILTFMARRAIQADERLVRAADRLR